MSSVYCQNVYPVKRLFQTHANLLLQKFEFIFPPTNSRYDIIQVIGREEDIVKLKMLLHKLGLNIYIYEDSCLLDIPSDMYGRLVRNIDKLNQLPFLIIIPRKKNNNSKISIYGNKKEIKRGIKYISKLLKIEVGIFNLFEHIETNNTYTPPYEYIKSNYGLYGNIGEPYIDQFKVGDGEVYQGIPLKGQYGSIGPSN